MVLLEFNTALKIDIKISILLWVMNPYLTIEKEVECIKDPEIREIYRELLIKLYELMERRKKSYGS